MNHDEVNRRFVDDLLQQGSSHGEVLDLGTGSARIPILLCQTCENLRITAVDLSIHMLDVARNNIELAGLTGRIRLDRVDSKNVPFDSDSFDLVISNSLIHHLAEPASAIREAARVVKRGGLLFFRDLLRPENDETVRDLVRRYAGDENAHARKMFEDSLRAALTLREIRDLVASAGFEPHTCQITSDRHWTWCGRRR
jgi:ubiquinone/menaquinone biosynthesis C-methylase UbiE